MSLGGQDGKSYVRVLEIVPPGQRAKGTRTETWCGRPRGDF